MRTVSLQQFIKLRQQLSAERDIIQTRLAQINEALGEMSPPALSAVQRATSPQSARRGRRAAGGQSLREHVIAVLQEGPKTKEEVLSAVQGRGYRFTTNNPLNSLGVILYGKNPKLNRVDGKFSLGGGATSTSGRGGRSKMSAAGRARIAAAQRARWAKQKGGASPANASPNGMASKSKRKMSAAGRKAIADAARKRWAAAKAAGKSRL